MNCTIFYICFLFLSHSKSHFEFVFQWLLDIVCLKYAHCILCASAYCKLTLALAAWRAEHSNQINSILVEICQEHTSFIEVDVEKLKEKKESTSNTPGSNNMVQ